MILTLHVPSLVLPGAHTIPSVIAEPQINGLTLSVEHSSQSLRN
jgi:hypothetical protein